MEQQSGEAFHSYREAVDWITGLVHHGIKPGLDRMRRLMEMLGHPERRLKFIHVAGTNGKGSTCAFLDNVLRAAGYDVGMFTSPYMFTFTNRFKYNDEDISHEDLRRLANRLKPLADELAGTEFGSPTSFEICVALAIVYFATVTYPDYIVLETGLGGRLDATNIITPVLSVITNIGHDHMDLLGGTMERIAMEKAGIIKPGVPVVSGVEQREAVEVIRGASRERKSSLYLLGEQFEYRVVSQQWDGQVFDFQGPFRRIEGLTMSMNGRHQFNNAAVAVMALEVLRQYYALIVDNDVLEAGLHSARWPGRLEFVGEQPKILLDGAHNPEGAESLAAALGQMRRPHQRHFMLGMLASKDHDSYLQHLLPLVDTVIVTQPDIRGAMPAESLAEKVRAKLRGLVRSCGAENGGEDMDDVSASIVCPASGPDGETARVNVIVESDWKQALKRLIQITGPDDLAVVTGTLYMISDVRSWIVHKAPSEKGW